MRHPYYYLAMFYLNVALMFAWLASSCNWLFAIFIRCGIDSKSKARTVLSERQDLIARGVAPGR